MKVIGLTGGIGSGKSTVSAHLREKGYLILDADQIAHDITKQGSPVLKQIAEAFGADMLDAEGNLQRKKLAAVAFANAENKALLESLTTAEVVRIISEQVEELRNSTEYDIIFIDAPLLFEAGVDALTDFVWMVSAEEAIRIARVMERDQVSREDVLQRIANQMDNDEKIRRSQEVIDNSKGKEELYRQVEALLKKYA
ncbi:MAG: dephospho-CoA kinase [Firmicutes bacterium]|nr:dephospho-CoA kinase [Bacillota bacterium]